MTSSKTPQVMNKVPETIQTKIVPGTVSRIPWTEKDDEQLCTSWLSVSQKRSDQDSDDFWHEVWLDYSLYKEKDYLFNPTAVGLALRWSFFNPFVSKFHACYKQVQASNLGGMSEIGEIVKANQNFKSICKKDFLNTFLHCYSILGEQPSWQDYDSRQDYDLDMLIAIEKTTNKKEKRKRKAATDNEKRKKLEIVLLEAIEKSLAKNDIIIKTMQAQNEITRTIMQDQNEMAIMTKKESDLLGDDLAIENLRIKKRKIIERLRKEENHE